MVGKGVEARCGVVLAVVVSLCAACGSPGGGIGSGTARSEQNAGSAHVQCPEQPIDPGQDDSTENPNQGVLVPRGVKRAVLCVYEPQLTEASGPREGTPAQIDWDGQAPIPVDESALVTALKSLPKRDTPSEPPACFAVGGAPRYILYLDYSQRDRVRVSVDIPCRLVRHDGDVRVATEKFRTWMQHLADTS